MLLQVHNVLEPREVATLLDKSAAAEFVDGALTAGPRARRVKRNLQIPADAALGADLREPVLAALARNLMRMWAEA